MMDDTTFFMGMLVSGGLGQYRITDVAADLIAQDALTLTRARRRLSLANTVVQPKGNPPRPAAPSWPGRVSRSDHVLAAMKALRSDSQLLSSVDTGNHTDGYWLGVRRGLDMAASRLEELAAGMDVEDGLQTDDRAQAQRVVSRLQALVRRLGDGPLREEATAVIGWLSEAFSLPSDDRRAVE